MTTKVLKQRIDGVLSRAATASVEVADAEERRVRLSFSSEEAEVLRASFFEDPWFEILGHKDGEVNLDRLNGGAPILLDHMRGNVGGQVGVVERAWVEKGRGYADVRLSKRDDVTDLWNDIVDGIVRNVSVGYSIEERTLVEANSNGPDKFRVTKWTPKEISFVDVPADAGVGVGRSDGEHGMYRVHDITREEEGSMEDETTNQPETPAVQATPAAGSRTDSVDADAIRAETERRVREAEASRREQIRALYQGGLATDHADLLSRQLDDMSVTPEDAGRALLGAIAANQTPTGGSRVETVQDETDKARTGIEIALETRAGIAATPERNEFTSMSLSEMARHCLRVRNVDMIGLDRMALVGRAFTSSDFPNILSNVANKAMLMGAEEAGETFQLWTRQGNLSDFKINERDDLGEFTTLDKVLEDGEISFGSIGERKEQIQLATYAKRFGISRQAIINDDLGAFTRIPRRMGRAAIRTVGDLVYAVLTGTHLMGDGVTLFDATHNNLLAVGTAPSVASIGAARSAMRKQKGVDGNVTTNILPRYLLAPVVLEDTVKQIVASETDISKTNSKAMNPIRNSVEIITDARLDAASLTAWYLAADPGMHDGVEVGYLDGNPNPTLEQQAGWAIDGTEFKVRIDAVAKALDWRTFYKNPGA